MAIAGDYTVPVTVNGFTCRNCTDVSRAQKNIDPSDPNGGPFGVNHKDTDTKLKVQKSVFDAKKIDDAALDAQRHASQQQSVKASNPYAAASAATETGSLVTLFA